MGSGEVSGEKEREGRRGKEKGGGKAGGSRMVHTPMLEILKNTLYCKAMQRRSDGRLGLEPTNPCLMYT